MTVNSLREWLDKPMPQDDIKGWIEEIWEYAQRVGDIKGIAELAEIDVIDGHEPASWNHVYLAAYNSAKVYHSIEVKNNDERQKL